MQPQPFTQLLFLVHTILLVELLNTSTSLVSFLLSSIEWMALRANFYVDFWLCRSCNKCVSTVACNSCLIIIWMDSFSHDFHLFYVLSFIIYSFILYTRMPDPHMIFVSRMTRYVRLHPDKQLNYCSIYI